MLSNSYTDDITVDRQADCDAVHKAQSGQYKLYNS
jgi:hypothetical protein